MRAVRAVGQVAVVACQSFFVCLNVQDRLQNAAVVVARFSKRQAVAVLSVTTVREASSLRQASGRLLLFLDSDNLEARLSAERCRLHIAALIIIFGFFSVSLPCRTFALRGRETGIPLFLFISIPDIIIFYSFLPKTDRGGRLGSSTPTLRYR